MMSNTTRTQKQHSYNSPTDDRASRTSSSTHHHSHRRGGRSRRSRHSRHRLRRVPTLDPNVPVRTQLEQAYRNGIMGGGLAASSSFRIVTHGGGHLRHASIKWFKDHVQDIIRLRQNQYLVDAMVRVLTHSEKMNTMNTKYTMNTKVVDVSAATTPTTPAQSPRPPARPRPHRILCAPHLPSVYTRVLPSHSHSPNTSFHTRRTTKWHLTQKMNVSLAEALDYAVQRCTAFCTSTTTPPTRPTPYRGILLPYIVSTTQTNDHANMIYIDIHHEPTSTTSKWTIQCYLFEPNGTSFARRHTGFSRLKQAWSWVHHRMQQRTTPTGIHTKPTVRIVGESIDGSRASHSGSSTPSEVGIQTLLGDYIQTKHATYTATRRAGYGVCGAITFWFFVTWLWSTADRTLDEHYATFYQYALNHRERGQAHLLRFIQQTNQAMNQQYASYTRKYIQADIRTIEQRLRERYPASGSHNTNHSRFHRMLKGMGVKQTGPMGVTWMYRVEWTIAIALNRGKELLRMSGEVKW